MTVGRQLDLEEAVAAHADSLRRAATAAEAAYVAIVQGADPPFRARGDGSLSILDSASDRIVATVWWWTPQCSAIMRIAPVERAQGRTRCSCQTHDDDSRDCRRGELTTRSVPATFRRAGEKELLDGRELVPGEALEVQTRQGGWIECTYERAAEAGAAVRVTLTDKLTARRLGALWLIEGGCDNDSPIRTVILPAWVNARRVHTEQESDHV